MKLCVSRALLSRILILLIFVRSLTIAHGSSSSSQSHGTKLSPLDYQPLLSFPSLLTPDNNKPATTLIVALDGTIHLVDIASRRFIWSFPTGSPIYHSYQAPINNVVDGKENASGLIECGDDWELILHDKHFGKTKLPGSIADYVAVTPTISEDGAVTLGSKRSTVFEVDGKTGRLIQTYAAANFNKAPTTWSDDRQSLMTVLSTRNNELADPAKLNSPEFILKIFRTDYFLQSVGPGSGIVLWSMTVSEFKAVVLCQHNENPYSRVTFDVENQHASDGGFDFSMPYACHDNKLKDVYRLRKNLPELANLERLYSDYQEKDLVLKSISDHMLPFYQSSDRFFSGHDGKMMPYAPMPISSHSLKPKGGLYDSVDNAVIVAPPTMEMTKGEKHELNGFNNRNDPPPPMNMTEPREVDLNGKVERSPALSLIFFVVSLFVMGFVMFYQSLMVKIQAILKKQNSGSDLKSSPSKKKRARKSGKKNLIAVKQDKHLSSSEEDLFTHKEPDSEAWSHFSKVDGRRIGKLFVSDKEIAKGSNGTIVLEGIYEGRAVAVKRLVQTHHDVAHKEIQNLIASDCHPNMVRWYGVEYDHDFVYLALERCTCSLDDLIQSYSDISEDPMLSKDQASKLLIKAQMDTGRDDMQYLWKANGYPSPLLLKLMRDVVSGLVHLHELGIVHRDLKPQNVLIIKERSLCAKLSDMGISKRLPEDMSSLGQSATGCGSSGWQAPEQLVQGRQTLAVDLFSLGCVLYFCLTAGRHPFGERLERDVNIVKNQKDLFLLEFIPEAEHLISRLLDPNPDLRPKAIEVLHHPLFWSSEMRLSFLRDTSDRVELEDRETDSILLKALESTAPVALGARWDEKFDPAFINNIGRYRRYNFNSVRDLLRVMRNKLNHYREMPQEIQELLGPVPEGFNDYFASRFPKLMIEVYKVICKYCKEDECFQRYFRDIE